MISNMIPIKKSFKVKQIVGVLQGHLKMARRLFLALGLLAGMCGSSRAQNPPPQRQVTLDQVNTRFRENTARFGADSNILVRFGLLADRTGRWVRIEAEACGHKAPTPTEFFLISSRSGHDYEALAVSFASGRDLHSALEFIGLPPGLPVDPSAHRYWPRGERVRTEFSWSDSNGNHRAMAEELILDQRTGLALPAKGLVFTGSRIVRLPGTDQTGFAADDVEPQAFAANFNHPDVVLDVPRQVTQGEVYSRLVPHPAFPLNIGQPLTITFTPEYPDGRKRVQNLTLTVLPPPAADPEKPIFDLVGDPSNELTHAPLTSLLAAFGRITDAGRDPYVTLNFDDNLTLHDAQAVAILIASIEGENGIRINAPLPDIFYYRALIAQESLRLRPNRPTQPWEFHWPSRNLDNATGTLTRLEEEWQDAKNDYALIIRDFPVTHPRDLADILKREGGTRVVFVYFPPDTPYHAIRTWIQSIQSTHPTIFIYAESAARKSDHD
jgi:hypothetical protein